MAAPPELLLAMVRRSVADTGIELLGMPGYGKMWLGSHAAVAAAHGKLSDHDHIGDATVLAWHDALNAADIEISRGVVYRRHRHR